MKIRTGKFTAALKAAGKSIQNALAPPSSMRGLYARPPPPPILNLARIPALRVHYDSGTLEKAERPEWENVDEEVLEKVSVLKYDITRLRVDAIVNAANASLLGGGGVDGAIHRAAGRGLLDECRKLDGCEVGEAKITGGYRLPATHIIHTVGPIYDEYRTEKEAAELLRSCYTQSLKLAVEKELKTIAFCSISTGVYGYPIDDATKEAMAATRAFLDSEDGKKIDRVIFCTFSGSDTEVYKQTAPLYFPTSKEYPAQRDTLPDIPFGVEFPPPSTPAEPAEDTDEPLTEDEVLVPRTPGRKASTRLKNRRMDEEDEEDESQVPSPAPETDTQQGADPADATASQEPQGPAAAEASLAEVKAAEPESAGAKPEEVEGADAKPKDAGVADAKPEEVEGADAKPEEVGGADAKPKEAQGADAKPKEAEGVDAKPEEAEAADTKPKEAKEPTLYDKEVIDGVTLDGPSALPTTVALNVPGPSETKPEGAAAPGADAASAPPEEQPKAKTEAELLKEQELVQANSVPAAGPPTPLPEQETAQEKKEDAPNPPASESAEKKEEEVKDEEKKEELTKAEEQKEEVAKAEEQKEEEAKVVEKEPEVNVKAEEVKAEEAEEKKAEEKPEEKAEEKVEEKAKTEEAKAEDVKVPETKADEANSEEKKEEDSGAVASEPEKAVGTLPAEPPASAKPDQPTKE